MNLRSKFIVVLMLFSCATYAEDISIVVLPSGKQVKVLGVGKIHFSEGAPALMLKYQTDLSLDDKAALAKEADEIWQTFPEPAQR